MREEPYNTSCNCIAPCGHTTDIEELQNMSSTDRSGTCNNTNSTTMKKGSRNTSIRLSDKDLISPRTWRCNTQQLDSTNAETLALCTCQQSKSFPFCDNTHIAFNRETKSSIAPLIVAIVEEQPLAKLSDSNKVLCNNCGSKLKEEELRQNTTTTTTTTYKTQDTDNDNDTDTDTPNLLEEPPNNVDILPEKLYNSAEDTPTIPCTDNAQLTELTPQFPIVTPSSIKDKINRQNVFSQEEVSRHCSKDSLWMIIKGNVYDITTYVRTHPGGERALLKFAGKDGTENVQFHSSKMLEILNSEYFIGKLEGFEKPSRCTIC